MLLKNFFVVPTLLVCSIFATHPAHGQQQDIVDTAVAAGSFNTLAAALQAAELVDALKSEGPFTVFAPSDEAFAALPDGTVEMLLQPENRDQLVAVLTYHVVQGQYDSAAAVEAGTLTTLQGAPIVIHVNDDEAKVNDANLVNLDIVTSNGVIHVIDTVLLPPEKKTSSSQDSQHRRCHRRR